MATCSIEGCGRPTVNKTGLWCKRHYTRWWRHGDPLKRTRLACGEAEIFFQETVLPYSGDECLFWPYYTGRPRLFRDGKHHLVARLVCIEEYGPPPTPEHEAAHSCGKKLCVAKRHLRWATREENCADKQIHGTMSRGEQHGMAILTEPQVREMLTLKNVETQTAIAKRFGVSLGTVNKIFTGKHWVHITNGDGGRK